jgi:hypothetical protein
VPAHRKTFVTESGFYELAVAAPSMAAARRAWGFAHDPFRTGLARATDDPAIIKAAEANPGLVLRRPLGSKGAFKQNPDPPLVKGAAKPRVKKMPAPDKAAIEAARKILAAAQKRHRARQKELDEQSARLDAERRAEAERWNKEQAALTKSLDQARLAH